MLEPFGYGNREPLFLSRRVLVRDSRSVGNGHLKLLLSDGQIVWDAIAFRQGEWAHKVPREIDVCAQLDARLEWRSAFAIECQRLSTSGKLNARSVTQCIILSFPILAWW
jgi:single-stranded-DNA-specific exonuclease